MLHEALDLLRIEIHQCISLGIADLRLSTKYIPKISVLWDVQFCSLQLLDEFFPSSPALERHMSASAA